MRRIFSGRQSRLYFLLCNLLAVLYSNPSAAVQLYSLYDRGCNETTGAIVDADEENAHVLTLNGKTKLVALKDVQLVARYDLLENPFPAVANSSPLMMAVTSKTSEGVFRAYATGFFENLVLFLDEDGKIRVVEMAEIVAITSAVEGSEGGPKKALVHRDARLAAPPGKTDCRDVGAATGGTGSHGGAALGIKHVATLVMSDSLRLDSFWSTLRRGYRELDSLRERTAFYARPLMFDSKTRLGVLAQRSNRSDESGAPDLPWADFPLYLEFGSGSPYRFQSSTSIGNRSWRMIPEVSPVAAVRSEFKSHLLHGMFLGNLSGFTAGKFLFTQSTQGVSAVAGGEKPWLDSSFNHLTLLGVDYGPWALSYGYFFPDFVLGMGSELREVSSTRTSSVWQVGYQSSTWTLEMFVFYTNMDAEGLDLEKSDEQQKLDFSYEMPGKTLRFSSASCAPSSANIRSLASRVNLLVSLPNETTVGMDFVYRTTRYRERARFFTSEDDPQSNLPKITVGESLDGDFAKDSLAGRLHARVDLGQWVALAAEAEYEWGKTGGDLAGVAVNAKTTGIYSYAMALELLL